MDLMENSMKIKHIAVIIFLGFLSQVSQAREENIIIYKDNGGLVPITVKLEQTGRTPQVDSFKKQSKPFAISTENMGPITISVGTEFVINNPQYNKIDPKEFVIFQKTIDPTEIITGSRIKIVADPRNVVSDIKVEAPKPGLLDKIGGKLRKVLPE
jgi:hypothetical protein